MFRVVLTMIVLATLQTSAIAQPRQACPNGQCPKAQPQILPAFGLNYSAPPAVAVKTVPAGETPEGPRPGPNFEWKKLPPPVGWGWVQTSGANDPPPPGVIDWMRADGPFELGAKPLTVTLKPVPGVPAPKFADPAPHQDLHGRLFYRVARDHWYHELVRTKKMDPAAARQLVESLSNESLDTYGQHVGIVGGIGDGKIIDWIVAHKDQIFALIKLLMSLFAFADAAGHEQPGYAWIDVDWHLAV